MTTKALTIIALYLLGMAVDILWAMGDDEFRDSILDALDEFDEYMPRGFIIAVFVVVILITALRWPCDLVRYPYNQWKKRS